MSLELIFAASLVATFFAWYVCSLIPGRTPRGILRATFIALLCSPGIIVGHGFAVVPSLFALYVQPSIFTLGPMLVVWVIALGIIFGVPALRNHRSAWPPSGEDIFLRAYAPKFVFFGVVAAVLMLALIYSDQRRALWVVALKYGLFFTGAVVNLTLCYWASRAKQARPFLTPLFFSAPAVLATAYTVPFMWYGGGAIGGLAHTVATHQAHALLFSDLKRYVFQQRGTPANAFAQQFSQTYNTDCRQMDLVLFMDGYEKSQSAVRSDVSTFRTTWKRPKWHIIQQTLQSRKP